MASIMRAQAISLHKITKYFYKKSPVRQLVNAFMEHFNQKHFSLVHITTNTDVRTIRHLYAPNNNTSPAVDHRRTTLYYHRCRRRRHCYRYNT